MDKPPPPDIPTGPSPHARRRRRIATASQAPQRGYYGRGYYEATTRATATRLLQATTRLLAIRLLPGYYQATTRPLPGYYQATTRLLPGAARAPLGQQHRSSSPARLPAPLTPATRSRRRRSAHQWKELEEAVLHMPSKLDNSEDQARHISSCSRMQLVCSPACTQTSPTKTSTSSEPAWAKWTMMELFMTDRHQHLPAATMLHVLDSTPLRHSRTSQCGRAASSRRAAAAARRSARGPHAPRSGSRARTAATSDTSAATHRRLPSREIYLSIYRSIYLSVCDSLGIVVCV